MIDSNQDKKCERNNKMIEQIEQFFNADNIMTKSEWIKKIDS